MWDAQEQDRASAAKLVEEQMQRLKGDLTGEVSAQLRDVQSLHSDLFPQLRDLQTSFLEQLKDSLRSSSPPHTFAELLRAHTHRP